MLITGKVILAIALLASNYSIPSRAEGDVFIDLPAEGDYLQGAVTITGGMDVQNFTAYEAAFTYEDGREQPAWFLIKRDINQVQKGTLAVWDTTTITDGEYRIRLRVLTSDGRELVKEVRRLHVSNYTPIPGGAARGPTLSAGQKTAGSPPAAQNAPITLPPNPAELTPGDLQVSLLAGVIVAFSLLALLGLYLLIKRGSRSN